MDGLDHERLFVDRLKRKNPPDAEAWKQLLVEYKPLLRAAARRSLAKYHLPEDCVDDIEQKTWVTVYRRIDDFEPGHANALRNWLGSIQHNHVRNLSREPSPMSMDVDAGEREAGDRPAPQYPDPQAKNPESEVIHDETRREIWSALELALEELSARDREIVVRRVLWKEDVQALADEYHLKVQTIYQITSNTKRKLQNYLLAPDLFFRVQSDRTGKESTAWRK